MALRFLEVGVVDVERYGGVHQTGLRLVFFWLWVWGWHATDTVRSPITALVTANCGGRGILMDTMQGPLVLVKSTEI